jgi:hypothetical protein
MSSPRDANQVVASQGSFNGTAVPFSIDNATGYLKAQIFNQSLSAPVIMPTNSGHDENSVPSELGSFNGSARPIFSTNADGYLRAVNS